MTILVDKAGFVAVAVDDTSRAFIKPRDTILVLASVIEDHGDLVKVRIGDEHCGYFGWVPRSAIAILTSGETRQGDPAVK